jgi:hypothetical protein
MSAKQGKSLGPSRGFIGPLGDDIPSIFPIVAGLLIFIGGMFYALQKYDERNDYLALKKAGMEIAYSIMEKGVMLPGTSGEPGNFTELCESRAMPLAQKNLVSFAVSVQKCCGVLATAPDVTKSEKGYPHAMTNTPCTNAPCVSCPNGVNVTRNPVTLTYPVTIPYGANWFGPGIVNIIVWRG